MNSINQCTIQDSLGLGQTESGFDQFKVASLGNSPARTLSGVDQISRSIHFLFHFLLFIPFFSLFFLLLPLAFAELENFQAADVVLGQPDFTTTTANNGGVSARSMQTLRGISSDGKRLFVVDGNNRVLIWNTIPTSNFTPADVVLGQPDFNQSAANNDGGATTARSLSLPVRVSSDGKRLFVTDRSNHRVLIWNTIPTINFTPADVVVGQPNFAGNTADNGGVSERSLGNPFAVFSDGKKLFIGDHFNNRVLVWNKIPTTNFAPADVVLGQSNFTQSTANNGGGISAKSFNGTIDLFSDGNRLFLIDQNNSRILIWNTIPKSNHAPADVVLGQPDFTQNTGNNGGISARTLSFTGGIFSDGKRLFIADQGNHRILIWNKIPTQNAAPPDIVLGQPNFTQNTANNGGVTARSSFSPRAIHSNGRRFFVAEVSNHRILIYNISGSHIKPDPQFEQGKAVVGKVFNDINGNGIQDQASTLVGATPRGRPLENGQAQGPAPTDGTERGLEGIKVVSDTGIYAITDHDGKYHFPYIETGQRVLKLDESTLPEGSTLTTDNPYKVTVTKGILTKVSFGVKIPHSVGADPRVRPDQGQAQGPAPTSNNLPLLNVTITQDTQKPTKTLGITAELKEDKILFTTQCNYYLFVKESEILLYDSNQKPIKTLTLPQPIPLYYEIPLSQLALSSPHASGGDLDSRQKHSGMTHVLYYQLVVRDAQGHEDRTQPARMEITG